MINLSDRYLKKKQKKGRKIPNNPRLKKNPNKYKQLEKTATTYEQ